MRSAAILALEFLLVLVVFVEVEPRRPWLARVLSVLIILLTFVALMEVNEWPDLSIW